MAVVSGSVCSETHGSGPIRPTQALLCDGLKDNQIICLAVKSVLLSMRMVGLLISSAQEGFSSFAKVQVSIFILENFCVCF